MQFNIDKVSRDYVYGWAVSDSGISNISVSVDGVAAGLATIGLSRPDVAAALPHRAGSANAGFLFTFPGVAFERAVCAIEVRIRDNAGKTATRRYGRVPALAAAPASPALPARLRAASPFPAGVQALLARLDPAYDNPAAWTEKLIDAAADHLVWLAREGSATLAPLQHYLVFLHGLHATYTLIARRFPKVNTTTEAGAKDLFCVASDPEEMLCISNHLYVLRSHGLAGPLAEFGCFKGYSSSCLSHACHALGIEHHIFDSFSGLPPSDSPYYAAGDFAGSFEEVVANIESFGNIAPVRFFRGYFADTLPAYPATPLAIWMDVDLRSSAADVMRLLPRLPRRSLVFTHECQPHNFDGGAIRAGTTPDDVLPPIVAAFEQDGRDPVGAYLSGYTGAVWDRADGIPPLAPGLLRRILAAV